jgi:hypothetical protein
MGAFTSLGFQLHLIHQYEDELLADAPGLVATPTPHRVSESFKRWLSDEVAEERRRLSDGTRTFPARRARERFGEWKDREFTQADAIRSFALRHYRARVQRERPELSPAEIQTLVDDLAASENFERRVKGWKVDLIKFRNRS